MLDPKLISDLDQSTAFFSEVLAPMMHSFYQSCLKSGFNEEKSEKMVAILVHELINGANKNTGNSNFCEND